MYLTSVKFTQEIRCFKKDECFDLSDITLLVGDQGCGKSTLLELFGRNDKILDPELTPLAQKGVETFYFDAEKMNPRIKDPMDYSNFDGTNKGIGYGNALASRYTSHGETLVCFTVDTLKKAENCIVFLDEPESSLSIRNQFRLTQEILNAVNRKCQLIIATHCLLLIQAVPKVLSLEHRKWLSSEEFIKTQKK